MLVKGQRVMPARSRSFGKLPTDPQARERLRDAQNREAGATAAVYAARTALESATTRRDEIAAAASVAVSAAATRLASAYGALAAVSGWDRAAALLGLSKAELRRISKSGGVPSQPVRESGAK
jgi:hypothetical protein